MTNTGQIVYMTENGLMLSVDGWGPYGNFNMNNSGTMLGNGMNPAMTGAGGMTGISAASGMSLNMTNPISPVGVSYNPIYYGYATPNGVEYYAGGIPYYGNGMETEQMPEYYDTYHHHPTTTTTNIPPQQLHQSKPAAIKENQDLNSTIPS